MLSATKCQTEEKIIFDETSSYVEKMGHKLNQLHTLEINRLKHSGLLFNDQ